MGIAVPSNWAFNRSGCVVGLTCPSFALMSVAPEASHSVEFSCTITRRGHPMALTFPGHTFCPHSTTRPPGLYLWLTGRPTAFERRLKRSEARSFSWANLANPRHQLLIIQDATTPKDPLMRTET